MDQKTNVIKWLAIITMTIDHIGFYLFPGVAWLRIIGRLAFPCYLYTTVLGTKRTHHFPRYVFQMLVIGAITAFLLFPYWNIMFTLAIFAVSLKEPRLFPLAIILSYYTEYGVYGFLLGWAIKVMIDYNKPTGILLILLLHIGYIGDLQLYAIFALVPFVVPLDFKVLRMPKWLGYTYYPAHQYFLYWLSQIL